MKEEGEDSDIKKDSKLAEKHKNIYKQLFEKKTI